MKKISKIILGLSLISVATSVYATDATQDVDATINVNSECSMENIATLGFGSYSPYRTEATKTTSQINITCARGSDYTISIDKASGTLKKDGTDTDHVLNYTISLAEDSSLTSVSVTDVPDNANSQVLYGSIEPGQDELSGNYSDTISVSLAY